MVSVSTPQSSPECNQELILFFFCQSTSDIASKTSSFMLLLSESAAVCPPKRFILLDFEITRVYITNVPIRIGATGKIETEKDNYYHIRSKCIHHISLILFNDEMHFFSGPSWHHNAKLNGVPNVIKRLYLWDSVRPSVPFLTFTRSLWISSRVL